MNKNSWGGRIVKSRFPRCLKCRYYHPRSEACPKRVIKHRIEDAYSLSKSELDHSLDAAFSQKFDKRAHK